MAAVFDGKTKIGRAVADPGIDDMLPPPGSLAYGAIATPVALSGTVGTETKLVHGDRWQQIDGNVTEIVNVNVMTTIHGNETVSVMGNQTLTTNGNVNETIVGNMTRTMVGAETTSNIGPKNGTYISPKTELCASPLIMNGEDLYETKLFSGESTLIDQSNTGMKLETVGTGFGYNLYKLEVTSMETEVKELDSGAKTLELKTHGLWTFANAFQARMSGARATAEGGEAGVNPHVDMAPRFML